MKQVTVFALTLLFLGSVGESALAHKVIASVFASGEAIEGEIGFSNGDMAAGTLVEVFDDEGNKLGEVTTDSDGFFTFNPVKRVVHVFKANLGSGHVAEVRMDLEDLPDIAGSAPSENASDELGAAQTTEIGTSATIAAGNPDSGPGEQISAAALKENRELIREMIHREVTPLRREIAAYKEKNDFQTILGGIGYIAGLFGVVFYLAARRKLAQGQG